MFVLTICSKNNTSKPLVSVDFNHNPASSIFDSSYTKVMGNLVKILAWYDNEWGFSNRMLDTADAFMKASKKVTSGSAELVK